MERIHRDHRQTYLAVFTGSRTGPRWQAWNALPAADRQAREHQAMAALGAWFETYGDSRVADASHALAVVVVRAASHETAARMLRAPAFHDLPRRRHRGDPILPVPQR